MWNQLLFPIRHFLGLKLLSHNWWHWFWLALYTVCALLCVSSFQLAGQLSYSQHPKSLSLTKSRQNNAKATNGKAKDSANRQWENEMFNGKRKKKWNGPEILDWLNWRRECIGQKQSWKKRAFMKAFTPQYQTDSSYRSSQRFVCLWDALVVMSCFDW